MGANLEVGSTKNGTLNDEKRSVRIIPKNWHGTGLELETMWDGTWNDGSTNLGLFKAWNYLEETGGEL